MVPKPLSRRFCAALAAVALTTGGVLAVGGTAVAKGAAPQVAPTRSSVLLPTGDAALVTTQRGHTSVLVRPARASGPGAAITRMRLGTHQYVIPATAVPFLGTVLDPALFDVTALAKGSAGRVSATVAHAAGAKAAVPGFTGTSSTSTTSTGYFTASGARAFGAALVTAAAKTAHGHVAPTSLFGATRISGTEGGVATPAFQQKTQIFSVTGSDGAPLPFGIVGYINTDSISKALGLAFVVDGEARVSLPVGHYSSIAEAVTFGDTAKTADVRLVTTPDFTLRTNNQVSTIDFRTANVTPAVALPKPSSLDEFDLTWDRVVPDGDASLGAGVGPGITLEIAPAPAPVHGQVRLETDWHRAGTASGPAYRYDTGRLRTGAIPSPLVDTFTSAQLAAVHEHFYADRADKTEYFGHGTFDPTTGFGSGTLLPLVAPLKRTDYVAAPAGSLWQDALISNPTDTDPFQGFVFDGSRSYAPGSSTSAEWMRPLVGQTVPVQTSLDAAAGLFCVECRSAHLITLNLDQLNDSSRDGHSGYLDNLADGTTLSRMRLYSNGALLDDEPFLSVFAPVPAGASNYTAIAETNAGAAGFILSTHTRTVYTFRSSATTGGVLPAGGYCPVDDGTTCRVLPLLRVVAPLPTSGTGTTTVGAHPFSFTIAPIPGAPASTVTAKVEVSFDHGKTFTTVPVTARGHNCFSAQLVNPASSAGTTATLRFTGRDAAGGTITETVAAAYRVASK